jgi:hypothetical protein
MRPLLPPVAMLAALLAASAMAQTAPPEPNSATPTLLAPALPEPLPLPTPVAPVTAGSPVPADSDLGTITAVPLPPPDQTPAPTGLRSGPPVTTPAPGAPATAQEAPAALTPIPLALPRSAAPPVSAMTPAVAVVPAAKTPASPVIAAKLPTPPLSLEASPADFLRAARGAVAAGRIGEARSALEMAQTRLLDRSVDAGQESVPSHDVAVKQISEAIEALAANDRMACLQYISSASQTIGSPID